MHWLIGIAMVYFGIGVMAVSAIAYIKGGDWHREDIDTSLAVLFLWPVLAWYCLRNEP